MLEAYGLISELVHQQELVFAGITYHKAVSHNFSNASWLYVQKPR